VKLPRFKGIEISITETNTDNSNLITLKLNDHQQRDIFYRLCTDIIEATYKVGTEREASEVFLARTWRWHHLLRGGGEGLLTLEEQKGLIGELIIIEQILKPSIGIGPAINAWLGPTGSPKDFEHARIAIESKARRGVARPYISISSEFQLDLNGCDELFLFVVELDLITERGGLSFTLSEIAKRLKDNIYREAPSEIEKFDGLLNAAGFSWNDNYSEFNWLLGKKFFYKVMEDFPSITPSKLLIGIEKVHYELSLSVCERFYVDEEIVIKSFESAGK
jgi:hypothetical protein